MGSRVSVQGLNDLLTNDLLTNDLLTWSASRLVSKSFEQQVVKSLFQRNKLCINDGNRMSLEMDVVI